MSQTTRKEILTKMQVRYGRTGQEYKSKLIDRVVDLFGYHRKRRFARKVGPCGLRRPKQYDPERLLLVLKPIRLAA